jgi:hypothetical protein
MAAVLSLSGEIKLFAEGAQVLAAQHAHWHLLTCANGAGGRGPRERAAGRTLFQTALELADARQGALFVVPAIRPTLPRGRRLVGPIRRPSDGAGASGGPAPNRATCWTW